MDRPALVVVLIVAVLFEACPGTQSPPLPPVVVHDTVRMTVYDTVTVRLTLHDTVRTVVRDTVKAIIFDTVRVTVPVIVPVSDSAVAVRWDTLDVSAWGLTGSVCFQGYVAGVPPIDSVVYRMHMQSADTVPWLCPLGRWMQGGEWVTSKSGRICRTPLPPKRTDPAAPLVLRLGLEIGGSP
jgi:hypothetical protein